MKPLKEGVMSDRTYKSNRTYKTNHSSLITLLLLTFSFALADENVPIDAIRVA
jgi:hypothetical protein